MKYHYIKLNTVIWDKDDPRLPENVIVAVDDRTYNDLTTFDGYYAECPAWKKIIEKTEETFKTKIFDVWNDWEDYKADVTVAICNWRDPAY